MMGSRNRIDTPAVRDSSQAKQIILLSGPIGAGKTTVGRQLVAQATEPLVYIEGDTFWSFFAKRRSPQVGPRDFRLMMSSMVAAALPYAVAGYEVVIDFSIPPWHVEAIERITSTRNVPLSYVVLLPPEHICARRAADRQDGPIANYSQYADLYADFLNVPNALTEDATPSETAARIRQRLNKGEFKVSWLSEFAK